MAKFIIVDSQDAADTLTRSGYQLLNHMGNQWFFLNDGKLTFDKGVKAVYTDRLIM